jgi:predicted transglutaminase-like cysteine proteinase
MIVRLLSLVTVLLFFTGDSLPEIGKLGQPESVVIESVPQQILNKIDPPQPRELSWEQHQKALEYGREALKDQCREQPDALWCSKQKLPEKTLTPWQIMDISLKTKDNFRYVSDLVDIWRIHSSSVLENKIWRGDCDDLVSTTNDIMIRNGQPRSKVWFALVNVNHQKILDHLVGIVEDADGRFWVVGDTSQQNAYPIEHMKYRVVAVAKASDVLVWFDPRDAKFFPERVLQNQPIVDPSTL